MRHSRRHTLSTDDVKRALELKGMEPIYGFLHQHARLRKGWHAGTGSIVYNVEDDEVDIEQLAQQAVGSSSRLPRSNGVGWKAHWLAVEGVQPLIPENPAPLPATTSRPTAAQDSTDPYAGLASTSTTGAVAVATNGSAGATPNATTQPLVKHILSRELQVYYQRLTEALGAATKGEERAGDEEEEEEDEPTTLAALSSLRSDPGLHQLVPYLCQWISTTIASALCAPDALPARSRIITRMQQTISSLLLNPSVAIEGYVHLLLPPILSTMLFSAADYPTRLRRAGATLLSDVLKRHADRYPTLRPRVARVLLEATFKGVGTTEGEGGAKVEGNTAGEDEDEDEENARRLPTATLGTKLGSILGLAACGGGMPRALLRATSTTSATAGDPERGEDGRDLGSKFRQLGSWIQAQRDVQENIATLEADTIAAVRDCLKQVAGESEESSADEMRDDVALRRRYGDFWAEKYASEPRALRGLKNAWVTRGAEETREKQQVGKEADVEMEE